MIRMAIASLRARLIPVILVGLTLTASLVLLLSIDRIQKATEKGFNQSLSGIDLIIGPRSGGIELVLYTGFHLGRPTNNITMETVQSIAARADVKWLVPIALGDSHGGFRVIATTDAYFDHIKFAGDRTLTFAAGRRFNAINEVAIGHRVAQALGYEIGSKILLTHGSGQGLGQTHDDYAFTVTGILEPTGTPNDAAVFVDLKGYELIHLGWQSGAKQISLDALDMDSIPLDRLTPRSVTAAYVGLQSKLGIFRMMREIADYPNEAISAVIPGVALAELWSIVGLVDRVFHFLSIMIISISLIGMITMTMSSLDYRTREMTILRAVGASPAHLAALVMLESAVVSGGAILASIIVVTGTTWLAKNALIEQLGIVPEIGMLSGSEALTFALILGAGLASSVWPAIMVYRRSLQQGLLK